MAQQTQKKAKVAGSIKKNIDPAKLAAREERKAQRKNESAAVKSAKQEARASAKETGNVYVAYWSPGSDAQSMSLSEFKQHFSVDDIFSKMIRYTVFQPKKQRGVKKSAVREAAVAILSQINKVLSQGRNVEYDLPVSLPNGTVISLGEALAHYGL